jgi:YesN/AraC family two-component response regulator
MSLLFAGISFLILFVKKTHATAPKKNSEPVYRTVQRGYSREQKKELIDFIGSQYGNPLMSLDFIQKRTSLNSYQVNEILKDCCNMLYKEYINSIRIKEAKRLLAETNKQIGEIAENVGYCYSNSFARIFRKTEHMTPNQYRKNFRKNQ